MAGEAGAEAAMASFAVAKGGVVLKHIFLNAPPTDDARHGGDLDEETEDPPVLFGRHPDCHVLVDHPSVSRRHLEIRCKRHQRRITVTDLSSVHGTWVSGQRIPPNTPVELAAGDTLQLGASRREYRLHWLSLREACEMEDLLPPLVEEDKEESRTHQEIIQQVVPEQIDLPAKVIPSEPSLPDFIHSFAMEESSFSQFDENRVGLIEEKMVNENPVIESAGSSIITQGMPATVTTAEIPVHSDKQGASSTLAHRAKLKSVKSLRIDTGRSILNSSTLRYNYPKEACMVLFDNFNVKEPEEKHYDKENFMLNFTEDTEQHDIFSENSIPGDSVDVLPNIRKTSADEFPQLDATINMKSYEHMSDNPFIQDVVGETIFSHEDMKHRILSHINTDGNLSIYGSPFEIKGTEENEERSQLDKENITPCVSANIIMQRSQLTLKPTDSQELVNSISPLSLEHDNLSGYENSVPKIGNQMESIELVSGNLSPLILVADRLAKSQTEPMSHLDFENDTAEDKENSVMAPGKYDAVISPVGQVDFFPDKKNLTPATRDHKPISRKIFGSRKDSSVSAEYTPNRNINKRDCNELSSKSKGFHTVDDEAFYSDKENLTPMSAGGVKARRCVPKILFTVDANQDQEVLYSDKENSTPVSSAPRKTRDMSENRARIESVITRKRVVDRLPFQTLLSNSPLKPDGSFDFTQATDIAADVAIRIEDQLDILQHNNHESDRVGEGMKVWTMVTDTDCLLDDESRKSIMLLKGIKGTHLVIPRIVIRELDCMKQREGLFRRSSKATSILQWIQECMENENWWINVQSSSELLPVAPTPPVTPRTQYNNEGEQEAAVGAFFPVLSLFSPRSFTNIVSPKTEDGILDCALLYSKLSSSSKNIVILSNSVTLKIKAMAEGLLCEGAKEFRETLMNPCSGRFMWSASAPRGSAWSCLDKAALAENYYNSHHHHHHHGASRSRVPRAVESARGLKLILLHNNSLYSQTTSSLPNKTPLASLSPW